MTDSPALTTVLAYYQAWTTGDIDEALRHVADDVVCLAPAGRLVGAPALGAFMEPFSQILVSSQIVAQYGDATTAVLVYEAVTRPVADAPGAEVHTVQDGRITELRIIFDRLPFEQARAAQSG